MEASELCRMDWDEGMTRKHRRADCICRYCAIWDAAYKQAKQDAAQALAEFAEKNPTNNALFADAIKIVVGK